MKHINLKHVVSLAGAMLCTLVASAQITLRGKVIDATSGEELIGAAVSLGGGGGAVTDYNGEYLLKVESLPATIRINYTGFLQEEIIVSTAERLTVRMQPSSIVIEEAVIVGQRIDEKQKAAPLSVETLDAIAIKQTASISFYNGLGNLKGVDLTTASLGFTIINMRGFNSTSPVRSLQIIDGVDNQAPGLNFSLGNFLGASELDVQGVELVSGASGPFYGPNAFNGVISIRSKDPFYSKGLSVSAKMGERELFEGAIRWADAFKNRSGKDFLAYKLNFYHLRAYDWVADNYDPVFGSPDGKHYTAAENPGGYDAVNIYGDEYRPQMDNSGESPWSTQYPLQVFHRPGYREIDLVDYNTRNYKANAGLFWRLNPEKEYDSPTLALVSSFGSGTTVYQGDNRFSLRNILFFQNRLELSKKDKYFIRAYATNEDAGDSYDPYFTALRLQENAKPDIRWAADYSQAWSTQGYRNRMRQLGYPDLVVVPINEPPFFATSFDGDAAARWFTDFRDTLAAWHTVLAGLANQSTGDGTSAFFQPGTPEFEAEFDRITRTKSGRAGGTRFFDKSALYHLHGEYKFTPSWTNSITVGANGRWFRPYSEGTIFSDTLIFTRDAGGAVLDSAYRRITNWEMGYYAGFEKKVADDRVIVNGTVRADKNANFDWLFTPALSLVYTPNRNNFLRFSFSSAIRNPTLTDQYLFLNVGRATLLGNLNGFNNLITIESLQDALRNPEGVDITKLRYIDVAPIRPEKVKAFELGYRTTLWNKLYMDAGYYYNIYDDFIGFNLGVTAQVTGSSLNFNSIEAWRVAANSINRVTTQGFNIGLNYYFNTYYQLNGNYSWNKLNKLDVDDPIIPAFNTPEHKFNIGISGRDIPMFGLKSTG
ncbi:MAG: TonB-dependent receptor domain-containing protein, partial [Saprospiraceae bacterium]